MHQVARSFDNKGKINYSCGDKNLFKKPSALITKTISPFRGIKNFKLYRDISKNAEHLNQYVRTNFQFQKLKGKWNKTETMETTAVED